MSGGVHYLAWASLPDLDRFSWRRGECWLARCFGVGGVTSRGLALGCGVCAGSEDDLGGSDVGAVGVVVMSGDTTNGSQRFGTHFSGVGGPACCYSTMFGQ